MATTFTRGSWKFTFGGNNDDMIQGSDGHDLIFSGGGDDVVYAGNGNDIVFAGSGDDEIHGGAGDDFLFGGSGNDLIFGDEGNDKIWGGSGLDEIHGGNDNDLLFGGSGNDLIFGGNGDDLIFGGSGDDTVNANAGNDIAALGGGNDTYLYDVTENQTFWDFATGGSGHDTLVITLDATTAAQAQAIIDHFNNSIAVNPNAFIDFNAFGFDLIVKKFEQISVLTDNQAPTAILLDNNDIDENAAGGIIGNITVVDPDIGDMHIFTTDDARFEVDALGQLKLVDGQSLDFETEPNVTVNVTATDTGGLQFTQAFTINVNDVEETIVGTPGDDNIIAGAGDDIIQPDAGNDTIDGGGGNNTLDYSNDTAGVTIELTGTATGPDVGNDTFTNIQGFSTGSGNDTLVMNAGVVGDFTFAAGAGNDVVELDINPSTVITVDADLNTISFNPTLTVDSIDNIDEVKAQAGTMDGTFDFVSLDDSGTKYIGDTNWQADYSNITDTVTLEYTGIANDIDVKSDTKATADSKLINISTITLTAGDDEIMVYNANLTALDGDNIDGGLGNNDKFNGGALTSNTSTTVTGTNTMIGDTQGMVTFTGTEDYSYGSGNDTLVITDIADADTYDFDLGVGSADTMDLSGEVDNTTVTVQALDTTITKGAFSIKTFNTETYLLGSGNDTVIAGDLSNAAKTYDFGAGNNDTLDLTAINDNLNVILSSFTVDDGVNTVTANNGESFLLGTGDDMVTLDTNINPIQVGFTVDAKTGTNTFSAQDSIAVDIDLVANTVKDIATGGTNINFNIANFKDVNGSQNNDIITADFNDNNLVAGDGNDLLTGGAGNDTLDGGNDIDTAIYTGNGANFDAELTASVIKFIDTIGTEGTDSWILDGGTSTIEFVTLGSKTFTVAQGTNANDTFFNPNSSLFLGFDGADFLQGSAFDDVILGGDGNDLLLLGNTGNDIINGGEGNDAIEGSEGDDILDGGNGIDLLSYGNAFGVTVNLLTGVASGDAGNDTLTNFENIFGSLGADNLTGDHNDNVFRQFIGNDVVNGNLGNDTLDFSDNFNLPITFDLSNPNAQNTGASTLTASNVENIIGSFLAGDTLTGDAGANILSGLGGDDTLSGKDGDDTLIGGTGNDTFIFDLINGNDTISGGFDDAGVAGGDLIDLSAFELISVTPLISDNGTDTTIDLSGVSGGSITVLGVVGLTEASDFIL